MLTGLRSTFQRCTRFNSKRPFHSMSSTTSSLKYPDPIVLKAKTPSSGTVIFLHGLGDSGHGWADAMAAIQRQLPNVKFVLPNAPTRSITCNMGMKMPGWYDILDIGSIDKGEDDAGLDASKSYLMGLVQAEIDAGTPSEKIIVGGFSQGGAMTYHTVFSSDIKLAGALVMSGYLPLSGSFGSRLSKSNVDTPLLACHGTIDPIVPFEKGKLSYEFVQKAGIKATFNAYKNMPHSATMEELVDVAKWINSILTEPKL